ncbi:MAG: hypothetical protein GTN97_03525 [Nitrosopumilaceae archaeon]|nr:hypothetical protein [Nitrosopumilaceae archaeon]
MMESEVYCYNCGSRRIRHLNRNRRPTTKVTTRYEVDTTRPVLQCLNSSCRFVWNPTQDQWKQFKKGKKRL